MCGRFTLSTPLLEILSRFSLAQFNFTYTPSYNIAPTQSVLTVTGQGQNNIASLMRWGLLPPWQKEGQKRAPLINARLETLLEKPTFRGLVNSKRCLIIGDGFYEWISDNSGKYPVYITLGQGGPFAFAGLWEAGSPQSCTIITQEANPFLKQIHHRMPVILTPETERLWLSSLPFAEIKSILAKGNEQIFSYHRVSNTVNSVKNNSRNCIEVLEGL